MTRSFYLLIFGLLLTGGLLAQQPAQYATYMLDPLRYNPAYAGLDHSLSLTGTYRQQWVGLDGNPTGQRLSAHLPLYFLSGGLGFQWENDRIGAHQYALFSGAYNYQRDLSAGILSFGISGGYAQWRLDGDVLRTPDGLYTEPGVIEHNDDLLSSVTDNGATMTFGAGLYFQGERIEGGVSVDNINQPVIGMALFDIQLRRTYYASVLARFEVGSTLVLQPSAWLRTDAVETQVDFSLTAFYNDNIFGGASFRGYSQSTIDAVSILAGFRLSPNLMLAYAYDLGLSSLRTVHNGSHELVLKYNLNKTIGAGRPPAIIYHPRAR
ncbi:MAG: PorP/SprF family type IX secretion system membrane protein [Lewinella sp.]|nr:PorP/SprF family type IX secretion system membrane protein [Lewinella sp.]